MKSSIMRLSRCYRYYRMYYIKQLQGRFATNTFFADMKLLHGNTCCQVYWNKSGFSDFYPKLNMKEDILVKSIDNFIHEFGASEHLTFNRFSSKVVKNTRFYENLRNYSIKNHVYAPQRPNENPAEGTIREIKLRFYLIRNRKRLPNRVW